MTKTLSFALLAAGALLTVACNTVEGAGRDLESAGDAVKTEAQQQSDGKPE
jgi:predicted small secreted protein